MDRSNPWRRNSSARACGTDFNEPSAQRESKYDDKAARSDDVSADSDIGNAKSEFLET
jgi:hypothetical protein